MEDLRDWIAWPATKIPEHMKGLVVGQTRGGDWICVKHTRALSRCGSCVEKIEKRYLRARATSDD